MAKRFTPFNALFGLKTIGKVYKSKGYQTPPSWPITDNGIREIFKKKEGKINASNNNKR